MTNAERLSGEECEMDEKNKELETEMNESNKEAAEDKQQAQELKQQDSRDEKLNEQEQETAKQESVEDSEEETVAESADATEQTPSQVPPADKIGAEDEQEAEPESEDPLVKLQEENKKLREQLLRKAADLDNFRKRSRKEVQDARTMAKSELLRELLPVFDNLERASDHAEQAEDAKAVAEGVKLVVKQFLDTLGRLGIERVKSVGSEFDPNVHEAIQQIESTDHEPGTVAAEVLGGYRWGEKLVRAAMVVVAKAPATSVGESEAEQESEEEQSSAAKEAQQQAENTGEQAEIPQENGSETEVTEKNSQTEG